MLVKVEELPKSSKNLMQKSTRSSEEIELPKRKKYQTVNGCTHKLSFLQIFGVFLMGVLIILHANTIPSVYSIGHPLLTLICIFYYICLVGIVV